MCIGEGVQWHVDIPIVRHSLTYINTQGAVNVLAYLMQMELFDNGSNR